MQTWSAAIVLTTATAAMAIPAAHAQSIASRIARVEGTVRFSLAARPGVCGNGTFIGEETSTDFRSYTLHRGGFSISINEDFQPTCRTGPIRVALERRGGAIGDLRAAVGVAWRHDPAATDLGDLPPGEAVDWLLGLVPQLGEDDLRVAFLVVAMADAAGVAERFLTILADREHSTARREVMRWVRGAAEREGMVAAADRALRAVAEDATEQVALRENALRRLGESRSDANATWIRDLALDQAQPTALRDRALRVLGDELARWEMVRALYARLDRSNLKERAVRVVAGRDDPEVIDWLRGIAESPQEPETVRDRAIRLLAERDAVTAIRALYPRLDRRGLRDRAIRAMAERCDAASMAWVRGIALEAAEAPALRERAVRELAEHGAPTSELVGLYDRLDLRVLRVRLIRIFAERGDRAALAKLGQIMQHDPDASLRREAERRVAAREDGGS